MLHIHIFLKTGGCDEVAVL